MQHRYYDSPHGATARYAPARLIPRNSSGGDAYLLLLLVLLCGTPSAVLGQTPEPPSSPDGSTETVVSGRDPHPTQAGILSETVIAATLTSTATMAVPIPTTPTVIQPQSTAAPGTTDSLSLKTVQRLLSVWLIALVAAASLLCCCCLGVVGLALLILCRHRSDQKAYSDSVFTYKPKKGDDEKKSKKSKKSSSKKSKKKKGSKGGKKSKSKKGKSRRNEGRFLSDSDTDSDTGSSDSSFSF